MLVTTLKRIRASQPLNYLATTAIRALLAAMHSRSEYAIKHLPRVGKVRSRLPNGSDLMLESKADDWVSNQVFWRGWNGYEPESVSLYYRLAAKSRVTVDVGAHVGFYSILAALANRKGHVYAFEPMPATFARLERNVHLNAVSNVTCVKSACGDIDGIAEFFFYDVEIPCSSSLSQEFMKPSEFGQIGRMSVPVISLDQYLQEENVQSLVDLVKIDTESTEPKVLDGMLQTLSASQPNILCEVLPSANSGSDLEDILRPLGYRFYLLTPDGPALREKIEGHPEWLNYLFSRWTPTELRQI